MDPISQAALGAAVAHSACGRKLGFRAAVWGAAAGALPDIDILFSIGGDAFDQLVTHRGITHSLFFAPVVGPLWGWLIARARGHPDMTRAWMIAITLALLSHPLLDVTTPYGTQLLAPFSRARFALSVMPIIDPVYTLTLIGALLIAWRTARPAVSIGGVLLSTLYIGYAWSVNEAVERQAARQLPSGVPAERRIKAYPTILQVQYRRIVVTAPERVWVGYLSAWSNCPIVWGSAPREESRQIDAVLATREGGIFTWFTMGEWLAVDSGHAVHIADLRYGTGTDPRESIFGIVALFDGEHGMIGAPVMAGNTPAPNDPRITSLWEAAYGECTAAE